ncbi:hypothetical protein GCM10011579_066160 [Streptomyces albiflavescens]|uniref:Uncharacterized protein n=1 Tax=Streptomyces albiflavescens TaxID=1623582 RepID=A0A917YAC1_9ACTN|nr:hypothetical protein [Streptomyces albiflavescens]GGN80548.1 hypothetical protein GCM10011579_066160 [Streptomyces albiflavescens]
MSAHPLPGSQVQVVLSDCSAADAGHLFAVLCGRFASDRCADDEIREAEGHPTMWTGTFDTEDAPEDVVVPTGRLSGSVTAEVQGTPHAVQLVRATLREAFTVFELGEDAGDQEVQVQLRLEAVPAHQSGAV